MSTVSPNLSLPYIQQNQAQKHVIHNEGMCLLDGWHSSVFSAGPKPPPPHKPRCGGSLYSAQRLNRRMGRV